MKSTERKPTGSIGVLRNLMSNQVVSKKARLAGLREVLAFMHSTNAGCGKKARK